VSAAELPSARPRKPGRLSIVVPCFNEEQNLPVLHHRLSAILSAAAEDHEIILVDDGSEDGTLAAMRRLAAADAHLKYISLSRNFGHEAASTAGLDAASGDVVVLIDADLQDPPELIIEMVERWRAGYDIVYAVRRSRRGEGALKRSTSHLFYKLINVLSKPKIPIDAGDFRLMDRAAVDAFLRCRELSRFVRGLSAWVGFRQIGIPYDRDRRHLGRTKYDYLKLTLLGLEAVSSFSIAPLRLALLIGLGGVLSGVALGAYVAYMKLAKGVPPQGYTLMMLTIIFVGSLNILLVGVVAEYVGKVFLETQRRPIYITRESNLAASEGRSRRCPLLS
jgi:glycosyltransferase involved in cell wall biosynthesis